MVLRGERPVSPVGWASCIAAFGVLRSTARSAAGCKTPEAQTVARARASHRSASQEHPA